MSTRSINKYFLLGTMALTGMVGFTACSSDEVPDNGKQNPTYNNGTVKTQFALNVPQSGRNSRMTAATTQESGFRGISDMRLLSFGATVAPGTTTLNQIVLGSSENAYEADNYRRVYRDVVVPVGTQNFVFYGTATNEGGDDNAKYGKLNGPAWAGVTDLAKVNFQLVTINSSVNFANTDEGQLIVNALNKVAQTQIGSESDITAWNSADEDGTDLYEKQAGKLYKKFIGLSAGSYASVKATLDELVNAAGKTGTDYSNKTKYEQLLAEVTKNAQEALASLVDQGNTKVTKFPGNYNLPDGVARLSYDKNNKTFSYISNSETAISTQNKINYNLIAYPASLDYTINTPVKASNDVLNGLGSWPQYDKWKDNATGTWGDGWTGTVTENTRSIGLEKAVEYAVARLQTIVAAKSTTLEDNAQAKGQVSNNTIKLTNADGKPSFWLTSVLIGGQPSNVNWEYLPADQPTDNGNKTLSYDYTIYDNQLNEATEDDLDGDHVNDIKGYAITTTNSKPNYTLVLDNNAADQAKVVYVTLEFLNNSGIDFYGADGVVPNGGKFYLVGKLNMEGKQLPAGVTHIFQQDYKTEATFTISSLKSAYNCIPDLRSSSISLGLAVNLEWKQGLTFSNEIE